LLQTDILPKEIETALIEFVRSGGILILDHCPSMSPEGSTLTRLKKFIGEMPSTKPWKPNTISEGKGFIIKVPGGLDNVYRTAVEAEEMETVRTLESWAREVFINHGILPSARCSDDEFEANLLTSEEASAVVVINHRSEAATADVCVNATHKVEYVCDLATGRAFEFQDSSHGVIIPVRLTQRQGVILGLYPKKPRKPAFDVRAVNGEFIIKLTEPSKCPIPVFIETIRPDGYKSLRHSREILLTGKAELRIPLAVNDPYPGNWKFRAIIPMLATELEKTINVAF
ncbi:MAG: hypothetical protein QME62_13125, partial [Armatimonadota bacterium]|nr:hypothetical protein [Armatimonadota bacterium]